MVNARWIAVSLKRGMVFLPLASAVTVGAVLLSAIGPTVEHPSTPPPVSIVTRTR